LANIHLPVSLAVVDELDIPEAPHSRAGIAPRACAASCASGTVSRRPAAGNGAADPTEIQPLNVVTGARPTR